MTSKRSFADLCKENRKRRLWPIALSIAANFFAQIVFIMLLISRYKYRLEHELAVIEDIRRAFFQNVSAPSAPVVIIVFGLAVVNALQGFSYLSDSKMSDLYGALPMKRSKLFDIMCVNGILVFAVPFIICNIITLIIGIANGFVLWNTIGAYLLSAFTVIAEYVFLYMIAILAAVLTGHIVVAFLGTMVFYGLISFYTFIIQLYEQAFFISYSVFEKESSWLEYFPVGPIFEIIAKMQEIKTVSYPINVLPELAVICVLSIVLYFVCRYLNTIRPSEAAGKAMAFKVTKPLIKIAIMIAVSLSFGLLFYGLSDKVFGLVFGVLCGVVVTHIVMETIYEFDFKASMKHIPSSALAGAVSAFLVAVFIFDLFGYDCWLPNTDRVESCAVTTDMIFDNLRTCMLSNDGTYMYNMGKDGRVMENMRLSDMSNIEPIELAGAKKTKEIRFEKIFSNNDSYSYDENATLREISFRWHMKNGKTVDRKFYVDMSDEAILDNFGQIFNTEEFKNACFGILDSTPDEFYALNYTDITGSHIKELSLSEREEMLEALKKDIYSQNFDDLKKESPLIEYTILGNLGNKRYDGMEIYNFYVFPSFTNTKAFLSSKNLPVEWRDGYEKASVIDMTVYSGEDDYEWSSEDRKDIKETVENAIPYDLYHVNEAVKSEKSSDLATLSIGNIFSDTVVITDVDKIPSDLRDIVNKAQDEEETEADSSTDAGWVIHLNNG